MMLDLIKHAKAIDQIAGISNQQLLREKTKILDKYDAKEINLEEACKSLQGIAQPFALLGQSASKRRRQRRSIRRKMSAKALDDLRTMTMIREVASKEVADDNSGESSDDNDDSDDEMEEWVDESAATHNHGVTAKQMDQLKEQHKEELQELKDKHRKELQELKSKYSEKATELRSHARTLQDKLKKYVKRSGDSEKEIEQLKSKNAEAEEKITTLSIEAKEAKESLASRDELVSALKSENEVLKRNLAAEKIQDLVRGTVGRMRKKKLEKTLKSKAKSEA